MLVLYTEGKAFSFSFFQQSSSYIRTFSFRRCRVMRKTLPRYKGGEAIRVFFFSFISLPTFLYLFHYFFVAGNR